MEFTQNDKITVKISWLFFAKSLGSLCYTENCENSGDLKHYQLECLTVLLFLAISKKHVKVACGLHRRVSQ